jgi:hypothetical protein
LANKSSPGGVTPEHQATAIRSRDLVTAQRIIDRQ